MLLRLWGTEGPFHALYLLMIGQVCLGFVDGDDWIALTLSRKESE